MPQPISYEAIRLQGPTGRLADNIIKNWLIGLNETNPAILDIFRDRDVKPYRDLLPWSGEFAGKYITGAYYIWQITHNQELYEYILRFIDQFLACQAEDGYLGCFSKNCRLTGAFSQAPETTGATWDSWGHYHAMYGLMKWYEVTGNDAYWQAVLKIAGLFLNTFYNGKPTLVSTGWSEMNLAVLHTFALLYEKTGEEKYLAFVRNIEKDFADPAAGDYLSYSERGMEFYQCPKPRWESMHVIMGIAELYRATGEKRYLEAANQIFFSILKTDVHNTGGFSTEEQAIGNPYTNGVIETCCVLAYNALGCQLYGMTGDSRIADHLELSHYNAVMGYFSPTGAWSTYNTPMDGVKKANYHDIVFQCRPGSPALNCCSVNAPRGVGQIYEWGLVQEGGALYLNSYEPMQAALPDGMKLTVTGGYPYDGTVHIAADSAGKERVLALRIPAWSRHTSVTVNGQTATPAAGGYYILSGVFEPDKEILFKLDFTPRIERGALDCEGKSCVYVGPVLYGFNASLHPELDIANLPNLKAGDIAKARPALFPDGSARLALPGGILLSDFYHLGLTGCEYRTWLPIV